MDRIERIAKVIYHREYIEPLWADLDPAVKADRIAEARKLSQAARLFRSSKAKMAREAYRRDWGKASDEERMTMIDRAVWFSEAAQQLR